MNASGTKPLARKTVLHIPDRVGGNVHIDSCWKQQLLKFRKEYTWQISLQTCWWVVWDFSGYGKLSYLPRKHVNTHPYHYRSFSKLLLQSSKFAVSPIPYKIDPEAEGPLKYSTRWPTDIGSLGICTHPKPGYHATSIDISPDLGVSSCGHPATSKGQLLSAMLTCISDRCQCLSCQLYMACVTNLLGGRVGNILRLPRHKIICKIIMIPGCNLQQTAGNCTTSRLGYIHHVGTMWASTALQLPDHLLCKPRFQGQHGHGYSGHFCGTRSFFELWFVIFKSYYRVKQGPIVW